MIVSLLEDLKRRRGWHSSIMTTYSVDPSFYDGTVEMRLRIDGCENNILLADRAMLSRALTATPEAFVNAGRTYGLVDIGMTGCFHPKLHLRLGANKARLVVGSANVTAAGWGSNQEIVTAIDWSGQQSAEPDSRVTGPLIAKAYRYLDRWLEPVQGDAIAYKRAFHKRHSPWLTDFDDNEEPIVLADGSAIDLLCERGDGTPGLAARLKALAAGEKVKRLVLVSPYWDADLNGFHALRSLFSDPPTVIALNPQVNSFPTDRLARRRGIAFAAPPSLSDPRLVHAKIIVLETDRADHLLFGSPNCSDDALGAPDLPARNAEVAVYRRLRRGRAIRLLELDLRELLDRKEIGRLGKPEKHKRQPTPRRAGAIELDGEWLWWWPPEEGDFEGAAILIDSAAYIVERAGDRVWRCHCPERPAFPIVARIRFPDGALSAAVIVHDSRELRRSARGSLSPKLKQAFDRVSSGESDLIDLALDAHLLFAVDHDPVRKPGRPGGGGRTKERAAGGRDFDDPEDFRRHVTQIAATGSSGRFEMTDPGLLDLLNFIVGGVRAFAASAAASAAEEIDQLQQGETEDGEEGSDDKDGDPGEGDGGGTEVPTRADPAPPRTYTTDDLDRRRNQLIAAVYAFEEMLDLLEERSDLVSMRLCGQTVFLFHIILLGCAKRHSSSSGEAERLMSLAMPRGINPDRDLCFAIRTGRIIERIWGSERKPGLIAHLRPSDGASEIADDLFSLIVMSRWAIARSCLALASEPPALSGTLLRLAAHCYRISACFGPVDAAAEQAFIVGQEAKLGFDRAETDELIDQQLKLLAAVTAGQSAAGSGENGHAAPPSASTARPRGKGR